MTAPGQLAGETISEFAIRRAWELGHFFAPDNPDGINVTQADLRNLKVSDPVVVKALISLSKIDPILYTEEVLKAHNRLPDWDGVVGPAMTKYLAVPRCDVPDHAPPPGVEFAYEDPAIQIVAERMQRNALQAVGGGNWPKCHGVGDFHSAIVRVDSSGMPSFLRPLFLEVIKRVQLAYAATGLLFRFINQNNSDMITDEDFSGASVNSEMSFVNSSSGWIGLAIVGQNERCDSNIWCKFLSTYQGGSTPEQITQQWTTLIKHELGHNCGRGHTSGGVMNPSIVNGLPTEWAANDPSTSWLKGQFGGVPVPIPGGTPPDPKPPVSSLESRVDQLELNDRINQAMIKSLASMVGDLRSKIT